MHNMFFECHLTDIIEILLFTVTCDQVGIQSVTRYIFFCKLNQLTSLKQTFHFVLFIALDYIHV